jgi:hypothetical protein
LEEVHARIRGRFARAEPRRRALAYLRGLLGWGSPLRVDTGHAAWAAVCRAAVSNWTGVSMPIAECRRRRL